MSRPLVEMADIVRYAGQSFVEHSRRWINWQHQKVLQAIARCRTAALGGHRDRCTGCGHTASISYNSCRNRHCPRCQGNARRRWLKAREGELLPTRYVHAVFTLPRELASLALQNKRLIYNLLFQASAETLLEIAGELIHVRRSWTMDRIGKPKSRASRAAVPCIPLLAKHLEEWRRESPYAGDGDWFFASSRNKGRTPRSGSILVTDYLKKAAYDAGVLKPGEKVQFGMHNLRHSLATYLIAVGCDVKTVQGILRHSNPLTTLQLYAHGRSQDRSHAQGEMLTAFFAPPAKPSTDVVQ